MKSRILAIKKEIEKIISTICKEKFDVLWYGAYDIDPKNLVFWICVNSDDEKQRLELNKELIKTLRGLFEKYDYPEKARALVHIGFESQETVERDSNGDWQSYFK
jgi:hypothetical protein